MYERSCICILYIWSSYVFDRIYICWSRRTLRWSDLSWEAWIASQQWPQGARTGFVFPTRFCMHGKTTRNHGCLQDSPECSPYVWPKSMNLNPISLSSANLSVMTHLVSNLKNNASYFHVYLSIHVLISTYFTCFQRFFFVFGAPLRGKRGTHWNPLHSQEIYNINCANVKTEISIYICACF